MSHLISLFSHTNCDVRVKSVNSPAGPRSGPAGDAVSILPFSAFVETQLAFLHCQQRLWNYIIFIIYMHFFKPWRLHLLSFIHPISSVPQWCDLISDSIQTNNKRKILILHWHSDDDSWPSSPPNTSFSILEQCKKLWTHDNYKPEGTTMSLNDMFFLKKNVCQLLWLSRWQ